MQINHFFHVLLPITSGRFTWHLPNTKSNKYEMAVATLAAQTSVAAKAFVVIYYVLIV
jgi:hypothetical protein